MAKDPNNEESKHSLKELEERYRNLFNRISDLIMIHDLEGRLLNVNPAVTHLSGYEFEELIGRHISDFIIPKFRSLFRDEYLTEIRDQGYAEGIVIFQARNGDEHYVEYRNVLVKQKGREPYISGLGRDITDRILAERALRASKELYETVFETTGTATIIVEDDKTISLANSTFEDLSGYSKEEIEGKKKWTEFVIEEDLEQMRKYHRNRRDKPGLAPKNYEFGFIDRQGNLKNISLAIELIPGTKKSVASLLNITDRKKAETALQNAYEELEHRVKKRTADLVKANEKLKKEIDERMEAEGALRESEKKIARYKKMESLGLLAGGVAHDLNNILSGIVSYPELLLLDLPKESKIRKPIETIQESGHRAAEVVEDLLTIARGVVTSKEHLNLNDLIGDFLHSPEFSKLKQLHPKVIYKSNLDSDLLAICGSQVHIRKVVMNLMSNASEAIEDSGNVAISTMNRYIDKPVRGYDDVDIGEYVVLSVSDDGLGISSDDLDRIFEPFYTKKVMGRSGTGLGLAVTWNVVQDHKGYVGVTTDERGTTFELFFPATRGKISGKDLDISIEDFRGNGESILVIDDVESQREISCKMLDIFGYKTKAVSSGEEAVEFLKENTVNLLLLDMIMDPGINGRETYERIVKIHPNQKAIVVSGFAETDDVKKIQKLGAGHYIKKPLTLKKLGPIIKEELEK